MSWMYCLIAISLYFTSLSHHSDLFRCKYGGFGVPFYLRLQALTVKNECQFFNDRKRLVLNPLQSHFPVHQVMWKGLSLCSWVKLFFRGLAVHTEPLLTLAQSALCHRINQKSWPQVAHRSHSHTTVSGRNSGCAHHMPCFQRGNQSLGLSKLLVPPPLSLSTHCTMPPTPEINRSKGNGPFYVLFVCSISTHVFLANRSRADSSREFLGDFYTMLICEL